MTKKSAKTLFLISAVVAVQPAAMILWEELPSVTFVQGLAVIARSLGAWLVGSAGIFLITWIAFSVIFGLARWFWAIFSRTPPR